MSIDVNKMEDDIMEEHVAPENEKAREMLDRLCKEELWVSAQELYLRWLLQEIKRLQETKEKGFEEKLLKYLKEIDNICGFSKDKRDVKIETKLSRKSDGKSDFAQGFVAATLLFCVGAMAIVGSLDSGISGSAIGRAATSDIRSVEISSPISNSPICLFPIILIEKDKNTYIINVLINTDAIKPPFFENYFVYFR